jgi:hypothetical protein
VTSYEWTFEPGLPVVVTTGPRARYTYSSPGWKAVVLRAVLGDGRSVIASSSVVVE